MDFPEGTAFHTMDVIHEDMYVFGGIDEKGEIKDSL